MKFRCGMIASFLGIVFVSAPALAVTYSHDATVRFTFNSELNVVIDDADIEILDLAPGTSSDSNVVGITISTNNVVGYTASATVGNATYNTTSMTNDNNDTFTSIATDANEASLSTDNTWGYTTSLDNGSSWANLSGLPIYTDTPKEIAKTTSPANDAIKFKINAKAATSQAAGDYRNVINFTVVANVPPRSIYEAIEQSDPAPPVDPETGNYTIQSLTENVCDLVEAIGDSALLTDIRDHTTYHVAKLADNRCWLQDNLALDIADPTIQANMTPENTNASSEVLGYLKNGGGTSSDQYAIDPVSNWTTGNSYSKPLVNSQYKNDTTNDSLDVAEGYLTGNYYNYCAASAGSYCYGDGISSGTGYDKPDTTIDAEYDICPAGWRMPTGPATNDSNDGEYVTIYETVPGAHGYARYEPFRRMLRLPLTGYYNDGNKNYYGQYGYYSSTTYYNSYAMRFLDIDEPINPYTNYKSRAYGLSVRCIVKETPSVTINFNANTGSGSMSSVRVKMLRSVRLSQNEFTKEGYKFVGWNTDADGLGMGYGDEDTYVANTGGSTITLYAQWEEDPSGQGGSSYQGRTLARAYEEAYLYNGGNYEGHRGMYVPERDAQGNYTGNYFEATSQSDYEGIPARDLRFAMQDADLEVDGQKVCNRANVAGSEVHLLDLRDNKSYWAVVTKNGKCWMTQNLDLDLSTNRTLTPADTDVTSNWTPPQNTIRYTSGTISGWPDDGIGPYGGPAMSVDVGNWYFAGINYSNKCTNGCDYINGTTDGVFSQTPYDLNGEHGHVGNYYNWHAAHATDETFVQTDTSSETSICPKGWFLPYFAGSSDPRDGDDIAQLMDTYSRTDMSSDVNLVPGPFYLVHSGWITVGHLAEAGINSQFWGREYINHYWGYSGYGYILSNNSIDYIASIQRKSGVSIRCLMR